MKFVDAHIHLSDSDYEQKVGEIMEDAKQSNVVALVSNSMDLETSRQSLRLAGEYPDQVYAALGIHPWNTKNLSAIELQETIDLIYRMERTEKK